MQKQTEARRPDIRKLGTVECRNIVETTPVVIGGELYRFEVVRTESFTSACPPTHWRRLPDEPCLRFVHVATGRPTPHFAYGHTFGFPLVEEGTVYVVTGSRPYWGSDGLVFYRSRDLLHWEAYASVSLPGYKIYNMNIAKRDGVYTLLIEISEPREESPVAFTFRFLQSRDLVHWTMTDPACVFHPDRYAGSPSIYAFEGDRWYYVGYLEAYPDGTYESCFARSTDLRTWEYSPFNPVLRHDDAQDKRIAEPRLDEADRRRVAAAVNVNNSDMELCEYGGRTVIYYSWGDQRGNEFLAEARYDGPLHELLLSLFPS